MNRRALAILGILIGSWTSSALCGGYGARIDEYLFICHEQGLFNGSVLVAKGDSVILHKDYGMADMEGKIPITADTRFKIGSITKQFTTLMIFQLIEEGQIAVDDPITKYMPEYRRDTGD